MPRLPDTTSLGERRTPQPGSGVAQYRPTTGMEDAAAETLTRAGADIQRTANAFGVEVRREKERVDHTRAEDALNKLREKQTDLTLGEQNGFTRIVGGNAVNRPLAKEYTGLFAEAVSTLESELGNDRQKELFRERAGAVSRQFGEGLLRHIANESIRFDDDTFKNTIEVETRAAVDNWSDKNALRDSMARINTAITRRADQRGLGIETVTAMKHGVDQAIGTGVVARSGEAIDAASRRAFQNPAVGMAELEGLQRTINGLSLAPALKAQALERARREVANAAVGGWINQNPDIAPEVIKDFVSNKGRNPDEVSFRVAMGGRDAVDVPFGLLDANEQQRWLGYADTLSKQTNGVDRRRMADVMRDVEAAAERGIQTPIPPERFAVFGPEADAARQQYANSQRMAADIASVTPMTVEARLELVQRATPREGGPGFAEADQRATALARVVQDVNRRQVEDPVGFSIQSAPQTVGRAFDALQGVLADQRATPEQRRSAAQAFASATVAEQDRLGHPERRGRRLTTDTAILPKPMAEAIVRQFQQQPEGGQGPAQLIQAQADLWGPYWPQVFKQVAKDIGPTARVVANLRDTPAAALLSMQAGMKTPDLRKPLPAADAKTVDETLDLELDPFRRSLVGWTTQGSAVFNDFDEAARRNAYVYTAQGMKPGDAAKRAARELVGDYYEIRDTVRIPKVPGVDARAVETGMAAVLRDAEKLSVVVPPDAARVLGADFTSKQLAASVKANGFFVTLPDDSGVALFLRGANGERAVEGGAKARPDSEKAPFDAGRQPITFTWKQLQDLAAAEAARAAAARGQATFGATPGGAATMTVPR